jgi:hypothetical protein
MEFPPFSATTTGEKASQTDGFQSIRRINRYPLRSRDKNAPLRLRVSMGVRSNGPPPHWRDCDDTGRAARAKLAAIVHPEHVLAELSRAYGRAYLADQNDIRTGVSKLLRQWEKDADARKRWWRKKSAAGAKRTRKKR